MIRRHDLSQLQWTLSGWTPQLWRMHRTAEIGASPNAEVPAIPAPVPGSVQLALRQAEVIPDWNVALNARDCEWVENREWIYETTIPDDWLAADRSVRLRCRGLDYCGQVLVNGKPAGDFCGTFTPHTFDLTPLLEPANNRLAIVFTLSPRWLGQFGRTSQMREWKARFNYTWDWTARLVQIGIWDDICLEVVGESEIASFRCYTDTSAKTSSGSLTALGAVSGPAGSRVRLSLSRGGDVVLEEDVSLDQFNESGLHWTGITVELWWPNGLGQQPLYDLRCELIGPDGQVLDSLDRRIGFREITWHANDGAPDGADPWICAANGTRLFLQGANWVPIRPNYADLVADDYRKRLTLYRDLGFNVLRVWGGAVLEKEVFYDLCDELGLMVWQEFPLSSSSDDCCPPQDEASARELAAIATSYVERRQHHASLIIWCGGNELMCADEYAPLDERHPAIARMGDVVRAMDPTRRYLATSPSGPAVHFNPENAGKGVHWDVHGPWKPPESLDKWAEYWASDDALARTELGSPGASSVDIIRRFVGECQEVPGTFENAYWRRGSTWWIEWPVFVLERGREPESLEEYVDWSQKRQAEALSIAVGACRRRFPKCGAAIVWMGHDCYPCTANTSIIDYDGEPKPAALAVSKVFREPLNNA